MILDRFDMTGKVAIVTGAGRGIGEAIGLALADVGARVVLAARTAAQIEAVAERARALGREALAVCCDVNERADLERLVGEARAAFGRIDVLVNNAGGGPYRPALRTSERAFEETLRFNLTQAFLLTRLVVPHMLEGEGGSVVNVSSSVGRLPERGFVAYGTAKAGLAHLTRLLAHELAPRVRVNALAVGSVLTDALAPFVAEAKLREAMEARTPMKRLGTPEDIAIAALYLASPAASWVTGKVLEIDGGTVASNFPLELADL
jgi:7-alpha-hydroxysteroid dehydrogenase